MSADLPADFWDNVSESRRRRIRRRTRHRAMRAGLFGGFAGSLITLGALHSNLTQLLWGFLLLFGQITYLLIATSPHRARR